MSTASKACPGTRVVTGELHRVRRGREKRFSAEPSPQPSRRPARVAVMLALAHTIQRAIESGEIRNQADAARRLGLTRARFTQLLDLTLLAPVVQEELLYLEAVNGFEPVSERALRAAAHAARWADQTEVQTHATSGGDDRGALSPACRRVRAFASRGARHDGSAV